MGGQSQTEMMRADVISDEKGDCKGLQDEEEGLLSFRSHLPAVLRVLVTCAYKEKGPRDIDAVSVQHVIILTDSHHT